MAQWTTNEQITAARLNTRRGYDSGCSVYHGYVVAQKIPNNSWTVIDYDQENYDIGSEYTSLKVEGTADATEANKLHDADAGFTADLVNGYVHNLTDDTYAKVTAFVDSGELTLDADIMVSGETYVVYNSRFTVTDTGYYLVNARVVYTGGVDQAQIGIQIYVDTTVKGKFLTVLLPLALNNLPLPKQ